MHILINGHRHEFSSTAVTVQAIVEQLGITQKRIAIDLNGEIVPRSQFSNILLADGDVLEIVSAVGGG